MYGRGIAPRRCRDGVVEADDVIQIREITRSSIQVPTYLSTYSTRAREAIVTEYKSRVYLLLYDPRAPIADKTRQYGDQGDGPREGEPEVGVRAWAFMRAAASRRMKSTRRRIKPRARAGMPLHFAYTRNSRNYPLDARHEERANRSFEGGGGGKKKSENDERKNRDLSCACRSSETIKYCLSYYLSIAFLIIPFSNFFQRHISDITFLNRSHRFHY